MGGRTYSFDADQVLKDTGLVAASSAATVGGNPIIKDVGQARMEGVVVLDVSAIETDSSNEVYDIIVQGSTDSGFASGIENLCQKQIGHTSGLDGSAQTSTTGRYELFFCNEQQGTIYRYLRVFIKIGGTVATGVNFKAFYAALPGR